MAKLMLVDTSHPEETRVVVVDGKKLEDFDFETSTKKQLKGNIYLAKVTRVEPSLQAAFVDYGGARHGFLAFSEIHPDYYQIPVADREALEHEAEQAARSTSPEDEAAANGEDDVDVVGGDEIDETERRRQILNSTQLLRRYKIQEVVKKRQILLVQVVKEERGTKGAALTTYLSLAGRYSVLMPNTPRGGGISRKIAKAEDRKRLKAIMNQLPLDSRMGMIVRTAGMERTKSDIKRDFDYLLRLWDGIREKTLQSTAPSLIHEEANLIKRSLRDLYTSDIGEILVDGEEGYRTAKEFMRMMIPSHARKIQPYRDHISLFHRYQVESQLDALHGSTVGLKSGGYIVLDPTEALVAIDVNSGRATKARNIEETATKTNLEAADEIARQLRLRDLAGLIVIDFIDMDAARNNKQVENRLKEAMKSDRARIQMGRISGFGLLELSRQRIRPSFLEVNTHTCSNCAGTGVVRSTESSALKVLRAIEEEGLRERDARLEVAVPTDVALYILNRKRSALNEIEERYGFVLTIINDGELVRPNYRIERLEPVPSGEPEPAAKAEQAEPETPTERPARRRRARGAREAKPEAVPSEEVEGAVEEPAGKAVPAGGEAPRKRRRRGKRGGRRRSVARAKAIQEEKSEAEKQGEPAEPSKPEAPALETGAASAQPSDRTGPAEPDPGAAGPKKPKRVRRKAKPGDKSERTSRPRARRKSAARSPKGPKSTAPPPDPAGELPVAEGLDSGQVGGAAGQPGAASLGAGAEAEPAEVAEPAPKGPDESALKDVAKRGPPRRGWWQRAAPRE